MGADRQLIREQVSMFDAIEMLELEPPNSQGKVHCYFHEDSTPSLHIYPDHFHAFCCGANGDVVWFTAKVTGQPMWRAEQFLLGLIDDVEADVKVKPVVHEVQDLTELFNSQEPVGPMMRQLAEELIAKRWPVLTLDWIEQFDVRVCRDGLWIPHYDGLRVVGIKVRTFTGGKTSIKGSTYRHPYGKFFRAVGLKTITWPQIVVLCEGEPDTWAMGKYYCPTVGLPSGTQTYTDEVHEYLCSFQRVYLALDADEAGRKATAKIMDRLSVGGTPAVDLTPSFEGHGGDVCDALANGWVPDFTV